MASCLFLSPEPPYPLTGGGPLRTASLLQYAARRTDVDLVLFAVEGASDPVESLPAHLVRNVHKIPLPAHSKRLAARVRRNTRRLLEGVPPLIDRFSGQQQAMQEFVEGRRYDFVIIEHFWCAPYVTFFRHRASAVFLNLHNIESEWHARMAAVDPWPLSFGHQRFSTFYRAAEQRLIPQFDAVLVPSEREAEAVRHPQVVVYPNAIPFHARPTVAPTPSIVFSGNLEYHPNQQAVRWFARNVWPQVQRDHPSLEWRILGKNPHGVHAHVQGMTGVCLTGPVENAIAALAASEIAIVPVLSGSGTRVKILEAWAAGLPVISTSLGAEGLHAAPGTHLLLADTPAEFAASITSLLKDPRLRARLAAAGRAFYEEHYTWDAAWAHLHREKFLTP